MEDTQLENQQPEDNQSQNILPSVQEQQNSTSSPDNAPKKRFRIPRNVIFIFSIISLCLVILFGSTWSSDKINELSKKVTDIETQLNETQEKYEYINNQLEDEKSKNDELSNRWSKLTNKVQELQDENSSLTLENTKLQDENKALQEEIASLKSQLEQSKSNTTQTSSWSFGTNITNNSSGELVWLAEHGERYHSIPDCGNMNPDTSYQVTLSKAQSMGLPPCKNCH